MLGAAKPGQMNIKDMRISREGHRVVLLLVALSIALLIAFNIYAAIPVWLLIILVVFVYRDPDREIPSIPLAIISPVDGIVTSIAEDNDPYVDRTAIRISMRMNYLGTYAIRSPIEGKMQQKMLYYDGPGSKGGIKPNMMYASTWIKTDEGDDVVMMLQKDVKWKPLHCYILSGERVGQGRRCGYYRFGSMVHVFLPIDTRLKCKPGDRLKCGSDIIAILSKESKRSLNREAMAT